MITNKQSEKRQDSIMVIEEKTLKTLIKKENKQMNTKPHYSLNKTLRSNSISKKNPTYELKENSHLRIELPNGMDLTIYSNENGKYCSLTITNQEKSNFKTEITNRTNKHNWGSVDKIEINHNNYDDCPLNEELDIVGGRSLNITLDNFINK
tara:strand:+ start:157 stop:612 length:456 start_codon:yes stop_codon:yes gene_type:complete